MQPDLFAQWQRTLIFKKKLPEHIAIIMDGNGRWAKMRGLPRLAGHSQGLKALEKTVREAALLGVKYLSVYAFSTENWKRPAEEINGLMRLFLEGMQKAMQELIGNNIKINFLGELSKFPAEIQKMIKETTEKSKNNKKLILNIMLNYGARAEIIQAVNNILKTDKKSIDAADFSNYLYTKDLPDPDLLIRTSGEQRISNFLLWQCAYTEFWFTKKFWPDFNGKTLRQAISSFQQRQRRQGGL